MKSLKIRLELNDKQATLAAKHAGVARHAYNWGLDVCKKAYLNGEKRPSAIDLHKKLVAEVKKKMLGITKFPNVVPKRLYEI